MIQAGWLKWGKALRLIWDSKVPTKLKGKFYLTAVRLTLLYASNAEP